MNIINKKISASSESGRFLVNVARNLRLLYFSSLGFFLLCPLLFEMREKEPVNKVLAGILKKLEQNDTI